MLLRIYIGFWRSPSFLTNITNRYFEDLRPHFKSHINPTNLTISPINWGRGNGGLELGTSNYTLEYFVTQVENSNKKSTAPHKSRCKNAQTNPQNPKQPPPPIVHEFLKRSTYSLFSETKWPYYSHHF